MFKGFREFVLRGNVVDLAVGVVIGAAFGTVVTAFVKDLLTPVMPPSRASPTSRASTSKSMAPNFFMAISSMRSSHSCWSLQPCITLWYCR